MQRIELLAETDDDVSFVAYAECLIAGVLQTYRPDEAWIIKIDHWFDHKWLRFSGKVLGALGVRQRHLTVPPFVANRLVRQRRYILDKESDGYHRAKSSRGLHHRGPSAGNLNRRLAQIAPHAAVFWYAGDTRETGRASVMGYVPVDGPYWSWFVSLERRDHWKVTRRTNMHDYEERKFLALEPSPETPVPGSLSRASGQ
jgi:hypothetical protein